jgi:hypothetical protein
VGHSGVGSCGGTCQTIAEIDNLVFCILTVALNRCEEAKSLAALQRANGS